MVISRHVAKLALVLLAGLSSIPAFAYFDTDILIQRALNSPDFHVKYSGVAASMVELRLNGSSIGTQAVSSAKKAGEVVFTLDLLSLNDGDNEIEIRLFDKSGKLLGTQKMSVATDDGSPSPVKLSGVKSGATVMGPIEVKVGFGREMRSAYVSFFVDDQFKSMTNSLPFNYFWDTSLESNGWHELQAWVVDENSITHKTRKLRVFVNNPSGRTERRLPASAPVPVNVPKAAPAVKMPAKAVTIPKTASASIKPLPKVTVPPKASVLRTASAVAKTTSVAKAPIELAAAMSGFKTITSGSMGYKPAAAPQATSANARYVTPKSLPTKLNQVSAPTITTARNAAAVANRVSIAMGSRVGHTGKFSISLNSKPVKFDVQPRVQDGVPLSPLRHLLIANGGKIDWENLTKTVFGQNVDGTKIMVKIGDRVATVGDQMIEMEMVPFLESGRTIVPLSFIRDALQVDVEFDVKTGHVLITSMKKK